MLSPLARMATKKKELMRRQWKLEDYYILCHRDWTFCANHDQLWEVTLRQSTEVTDILNNEYTVEDLRFVPGDEADQQVSNERPGDDKQHTSRRQVFKRPPCGLPLKQTQTVFIYLTFF